MGRKAITDNPEYTELFLLIQAGQHHSGKLRTSIVPTSSVIKNKDGTIKHTKKEYTTSVRFSQKLRKLRDNRFIKNREGTKRGVFVPDHEGIGNNILERIGMTPDITAEHKQVAATIASTWCEQLAQEYWTRPANAMTLNEMLEDIIITLALYSVEAVSELYGVAVKKYHKKKGLIAKIPALKALADILLASRLYVRFKHSSPLGATASSRLLLELDAVRELAKQS